MSLLAGCGASGFVNEQYAFSDVPDDITVAVYPSVEPGSLASFADSVTVALFDTTAYDAVMPHTIRGTLEEKPQLADYVSRLQSHEYTDEQREGGSGVSIVLEPDESAAIREGFASRFLLVPTDFHLGTLLGRATGAATYRLYDLDRDALIYEKSRNVNVNDAGKRGRLMCTLILIGQSRDVFEETFVGPVRELSAAAGGMR